MHSFYRYPYSNLIRWPYFLLISLSLIISYLFLDMPLAYFFSHVQDSCHWICLLVYKLFLGKFILPIIFLCVMASFIYPPLNQLRYWLLALLLCLILGQFFLVVIKPLVGRARPFIAIAHGENHNIFSPLHLNNDYWSFPSGHTINIMLLSGFLGLRYLKYQKLWICLGLSISFIRVVSCEHFLTDCMFSAYFSLSLISIFAFVLDLPILKSYSFIKNLKKGFEEKI